MKRSSIAILVVLALMAVAAGAATMWFRREKIPVVTTEVIRTRDLEAVKAGYAAAGVAADVHAFIGDMPRQMAGPAHDEVGATTLAELTAAGRASILVPFPQATDDHQRANAQTIEAAGAAVMIEEKDLTGERLAAEIRALLTDDERRQAMALKARGLARPDAAEVIATRAEALLERTGER